MSRGRIVILGVAAVVALLVMFVMRPGETPITTVAESIKEQEAKLPPKHILIADKNLPMGSYIDSGDLGWREEGDIASIPASAILRAKHPNAVKELHGWIIDTELSKGDIVSIDMMIDARGAGFIATQLAPGMRAMAVRIDSSHASGGFITPNDRVDVLLVRNLSEESSSARRQSKAIQSRIILENVRVMGVDDIYSRAGQDKGKKSGSLHHIPGAVATLEVARRDAEVLAAATELGKIHLSLRGINDRNSPQGVTEHGVNLLPSAAGVPFYAGGETTEILKVGNK